MCIIPILLAGHKQTKTFKDVYFARMPVMVRSSLCSLNTGDDYEKGECPHDPGGYFIVNGREKTLVVQERISPNIIFCFSPSECLYHAEYDPIGHRVSTLRIKVRKFGSSSICSEFARNRGEIFPFLFCGGHWVGKTTSIIL